MSEGDVSLDTELAAFLHAQITEHGIHRIVEMQAHQTTRPAEPFSFFAFQRRLPLEAAGTR